MAISKILKIGPAKKGNPMRSLKAAIDYVINPAKTEDGVLTGAVNVFTEKAYEMMADTKRQFDKTDKRQGYHLIISFNPHEADARTAYEVIQKFTEEYIGRAYEAVFSVHDNTDVIHGHIVFNSVSFLDGAKYRYEKGDWAKDIQPLLNRICREYGLKELEIDESIDYKKHRDVVTEEGNLGKWKDMILRDVDAMVIHAVNFEDFLYRMENLGYRFKGTGRTDDNSLKYLAIKPMGMKRFRRMKSLGPGYSEEELKQRIAIESLSSYVGSRKPERKGHFFVVRHKTLSDFQKRYVAMCFRLGIYRRKSYSQAFKYKEDLKKLRDYQEQSLFILQNNIKDEWQLRGLFYDLDDRKRELKNERRRLEMQRKRFREYTGDKYTSEELEVLIASTEERLAIVRMELKEVNTSWHAADRIIKGIEKRRENYEDGAEPFDSEKLLAETEKDKVLDKEKTR